MVASVAATEAMKLLVAVTRWDGCGKRYGRSMFGNNEQAEIAAGKPRAGCRACGERDFVHLAGEARPHITLAEETQYKFMSGRGQLILPRCSGDCSRSG